MNFGYFLDQKVWIQCSRLGHYSGWDIIQDWDIIQIITVSEEEEVGEVSRGGSKVEGS